MSTRRGFVKKITTGLTGSLVMPELLVSSKNKVSQGAKDFWDTVRNNFSLSNERTYFNTGTFGPPSFRVLERVKQKMDEFARTGEYGSTDTCRQRISKFLNVKSEEISLTHNTTEGINIVTWGLPLRRGDEVIITKQEHVGNALPWLNRAKLHGIVLKPFEPAHSREDNIRLVERLITAKTKVIAIPHVTCTTGLVLPVEEICSLARRKGVYTAIDGAQSIGCLDIQLHHLDCDFYSGCCHKWMLAPAGTGFLFVREKLLDFLQPYWVGAHSDIGWDLNTSPPELVGYAKSAHRYDFGTQNTALYSGAEEAIGLLEEIGMQRIEKRVRELSGYLLGQLLEMGQKVELNTPVEEQSRAGIVSFKPKKMDYLDFYKLAGKNKFRVRAVPESNQNCIRVSTHIFNSKPEIDRFVEMVRENL